MDINTNLGDPLPAGPVLLPSLEQEARAVLERHGCVISRDDKAYVVSFPQGTIKREILPRLPITETWRVFLPDGYELLESRDSWRAINNLYYRSVAE